MRNVTTAVVCTLAFLLVGQGCSRPFRSHYSHEYVSCTMSNGWYELTVYAQRATGTPSERLVVSRVCDEARKLTRPTAYDGPVSR